MWRLSKSVQVRLVHARALTQVFNCRLVARLVGEIPMFKKLTSLAMATLTMLSLSLATVQPAAAHDGRGIGVGIAAGIIGLGILGAAAHARDRDAYYANGGCYKGPERCGWSDRRCFENRYGDTVCRGGVYRCWRPTICD
jgi:hypothetical protein